MSFTSIEFYKAIFRNPEEIGKYNKIARSLDRFAKNLAEKGKNLKKEYIHLGSFSPQGWEQKTEAIIKEGVFYMWEVVDFLKPGTFVFYGTKNWLRTHSSEVIRKFEKESIPEIFPKVEYVTEFGLWQPTRLFGIYFSLKNLLEALNLKTSDLKLVDPGSGDGRVPFLSNIIFGIDSMGIEGNHLLFSLMQEVFKDLSSQFDLSRIEFHEEDFFQVDFSNFNLVFSNNNWDINKKLIEKCADELRRGSIIISETPFSSNIPKDFSPLAIQGSNAFIKNK